VHTIKLTDATPARVQEWKRSFVAKAGTDAIALRKARISVNSIMRQARSLFSPKILRHLDLSLPNPLPFAGVEFEPRQSMKYRSEIDIATLIKAANKELRTAAPEAYKIFLLAVAVGLRRKEIDLLEWSSFQWEENVIRIQPTRFFHPKSEDSLADLPADAEVMDLFRRFHQSKKGVFVIKSKRPPLPAKPQQYYRCESIFHELTEWLREHGVSGNSRSIRCGKNTGLCSLEPTEFMPHRALFATPTYVPPRSITVIRLPELCQASADFWPKNQKRSKRIASRAEN
jgi:integrase